MGHRDLMARPAALGGSGDPAERQLSAGVIKPAKPSLSRMVMSAHSRDSMILPMLLSARRRGLRPVRRW